MVSVPSSQIPTEMVGFVKIASIKDSRKFEVAPRDASTPSIEGDFINDTAKTDKSIGRMRHGLFHKALWNYTLKGNENIYGLCRKIVSSSLVAAGYEVVEEGHEQYSSALPLSIDILQFWAWMQPKVNIDLNFDGEISVQSVDEQKTINVTAEGTDMFSTPMAGVGNWTKLVNTGVSNLQDDLTSKLKMTKSASNMR